MKNYLLICVIVSCSAGCTKPGSNAMPEVETAMPQPAQPKIKIAAFAANYFGQNLQTEALANAIALPSATNVVLGYSELSGKVKDVNWLIDGTPVGNGNNVTVFVETLGTKQLTIRYTDVSNGRIYTELLQLKPFRYVHAKITVKTSNDVCGAVTLFASKGQQQAIIDCATGTVTVDNYIFQVSNYTSSVFVGYTRDSKYPHLLLLLDPTRCADFAPGAYSIDGNDITIFR